MTAVPAAKGLVTGDALMLTKGGRLMGKESNPTIPQAGPLIVADSI